ncbi:type II toxin-antitoxin system death-on-curing family toxin [Halobacteriovorax sp. RT-1-4]|uniref:type II toxin-antitoxin system death-on-curing family toxin n=1 Tax=unclassified Halobacteriovorax TaxID=2639665 RepID=UPI00399C2089
MNAFDIKKEQVVLIHDKLCEDAIRIGDPIVPSGVKCENMLESSLATLAPGPFGAVKYDTIEHKAAVLIYSMISNHAFHNGNKRTALVTMMAFLDLNLLTLKSGVSQEALFCLFISCASHRLKCFRKCKNNQHYLDLKEEIEKGAFSCSDKYFKDMDKEIIIIRDWLKKYTRRCDLFEMKVGLRQLNKLLRQFGFSARTDSFNRLEILKKKKVLGVSYEKSYCYFPKIYIRCSEYRLSKKEISTVRKNLQLDPVNGVDSQAFYQTGGVIYDEFIKKYRVVLRDLSEYDKLGF